MKNIQNAIRLLEANGYHISAPEKSNRDPEESEYWKAVRTGKFPEIWPPIFMSRDELEHFRNSCQRQP